MWKLAFLYFFLIVVLFTRCTNPENKQLDSAFTGPVYYNLKVWGEEGNDSINCFFQYHSPTMDGPVIFPGEKELVKIDNKDLKPDSAKLSGPYYDLRLTKKGFSGKHELEYATGTNKLTKTVFEFHVFNPAPGWPLSIKRGEHQLLLENLSQGPTTIRLSMVDTSFDTNDFNELVTVEKGRLHLTADMLKDLSPGPISLEITREEEKVNENGRIWTSYSIRREFELVD